MLVTTPEDFDRAIKRLNQYSGPIILDIEGTGLNPYLRESPARMCGIAVGALEMNELDTYFSFRHGEGPNLPMDLLPVLREALRYRTWVGWNIGGYDIPVLAFDGFEMPTHIEDLILWAHLANENEESLALKEIGKKYVEAGAADAEVALKEELKKRGLKGKGEMWRLPAEVVFPYVMQDLNLPRQLRKIYGTELDRWGLRQLAAEVNEFRLALTRMEQRGLLLDKEEVHRQIANIGPTIKESKERIYALAGRDITNKEHASFINSPAQLKDWLKLPKTDKLTLSETVVRDQREDCKLLLDYREAFKAESTYFRPFLELADANDRLHTSYKVHGTVTGRLSSSKPNLQNASRDQVGRSYSIRKCFTAPTGYFLAQFDYSAIEPRIAAHYSGDEVMRQAFLQNVDFHTAVARSVYKKGDISKDERTNAKTIGLMTIYGGGSHKAARKLGLRHEKRADGTFAPCYHDVWTFQGEELVQVPCHLADPEFCTHAGKGFRQKFFDGVPALQPFLKSVASKAEQHRYVRNPISRRVRRFTGPRARPYSAPNAVIQSTAEHILRKAIVELDKKFTRPEHPRLVLTVHDSASAEIAFGPDAGKYVRLIKDTMENIVKLSVPLVVDVEVGLSLGNMAKIVLD